MLASNTAQKSLAFTKPNEPLIYLLFTIAWLHTESATGNKDWYPGISAATADNKIKSCNIVPLVNLLCNIPQFFFVPLTLRFTASFHHSFLEKQGILNCCTEQKEFTIQWYLLQLLAV